MRTELKVCLNEYKKNCSILGLKRTLSSHQFSNLLPGLNIKYRSAHFQLRSLNYKRAGQKCYSIFNPNSEIGEDPNNSQATPYCTQDL